MRNLASRVVSPNEQICYVRLAFYNIVTENCKYEDHRTKPNRTHHTHKILNQVHSMIFTKSHLV